MDVNLRLIKNVDMDVNLAVIKLSQKWFKENTRLSYGIKQQAIYY